MLRNSELINLIDRAINQDARIRKGNEAVYFCPFCNHYKKKLEVNVDTEEWHCWVCHAAGKSIWSLFKKLKVNRVYYTELNSITGGKSYTPSFTEEKEDIRNLPDDFIPLTEVTKSLEYGIALSYLKKRGITKDDIIRYNIGYCETGEYKHRILIPSYDKTGEINFFSARAYYDSNYFKYKLPPWSKNIIGFEMFINWREPINIVEGQFDAIAIRRNTIPLFGTRLSDKLKEAIIENNVNEVNIILDNDALKNAIRIYDDIEKLKTHKINIYLIQLENKDPSVLGFNKINEIIEKQKKPFDFEYSIKLRMNL